MKRIPVKSSAVKSIGYEDGVLEVEYASGGRYRFTGISQAQYDALHNSGGSIGRQVNDLRKCCTGCTKCEDDA